MRSNDGIMMQKYYEGTPLVINLATEIGKSLGVVDASFLRKPRPSLRKENRIKTIQSSLAIEGNTLSIEQVSAIFDHKRVIGPAKDILEVQNAIDVYGQLESFDPFSMEDYLKAHELLMKGLIPNAGQYRTKSVGIFKGGEVSHMAPPAWNVNHLMSQLFDYLRDGADNLLIKSCVFHYEMEFIHPFMDGNGRMGRLWQTIILMQENPIFEYLSLEQRIRDSQQTYYEVLSQSDKAGISTRFVEYMLKIIRDSLEELVGQQRQHLSDIERLHYFREHHKPEEFSRKDYMNLFRHISTATATRDLRKGVEMGLLKREGENRLARYQFIS